GVPICLCRIVLGLRRCDARVQLTACPGLRCLELGERALRRSERCLTLREFFGELKPRGLLAGEDAAGELDVGHQLRRNAGIALLLEALATALLQVALVLQLLLPLLPTSGHLGHCSLQRSDLLSDGFQRRIQCGALRRELGQDASGLRQTAVLALHVEKLREVGMHQDCSWEGESERRARARRVAARYNWNRA